MRLKSHGFCAARCLVSVSSRTRFSSYGLWLTSRHLTKWYLAISSVLICSLAVCAADHWDHSLVRTFELEYGEGRDGAPSDELNRHHRVRPSSIFLPEVFQTEQDETSLGLQPVHMLAAEPAAACDMDCHQNLNFALEGNCTRILTPDMFLVNNAMALASPEYYKVVTIIGNGLIVPDNILRRHHVGQPISVTVTWIGPSTCPGGSCMTMVTLKGEKQPFISGTGKRTVYCNDPFLALDPSDSGYSYKPDVVQSCGGLAIGPTFVADWIDVKDCVLGLQDTAKIIYREWYAESSDGVRTVAFDTICVLRLPPLSANNVMCVEKDTLFCSNPGRRVGPYIILPPADGNLLSECDTIYFMGPNRTLAKIDAKCGLSTHLDSVAFGEDGCNKLTKYTVTVHQSCYGSQTLAGVPCLIPDGESDVLIEGDIGGPIYATCEFWLMELDTTPPTIECDFSAFGQVDTIDGLVRGFIGSGVDCGSAGMTLPAAFVQEECSEIKIVKAIIDDSLGLVTYHYDTISHKFEADETNIILPFRDEPYRIILEAYDACHNVGKDTCLLAVFDATSPTAVAHRGLNLEMNGKLTYLQAEQLDNNSYDNCEVLLILGRRLDWQEGPLDLCDSTRLTHQVFKSDVDSIHCAVFESDPAIDELEAFYAQEIALLQYLSNPCGALLAAAWQYDLCKYATLTCQGELDETTFNEIYQKIYGSEDFEQISLIGGGWASAIPFDCDDVCSEVAVELLVMDYWCNWSKTWTTVLVEDKTEAAIVNEASDTFSISCAAFTTDSSYNISTYPDPQPLASLVKEAAIGDAEALGLLDQILGGYEKAWLNASNQYVDAEGQLIDAAISFTDSKVCTCTTTTVPITYYDSGLDDFVTVDSMITHCYEKDSILTLQNGVVAVNCNDNTFCEQRVTLDLDECDLGTVKRVWKIWKTCGNETRDTVTEEQVIQIVNYCDLTKDLFELPRDTMISSCAPVFDPANSGNVVGSAHPDSIGQPIYQLDDCRILGVAHDDKVLTVINGMGTCYVITRTWYFADWCINSEFDMWWQNAAVVADTFIQTIVLADTTAPEGAITFVGAIDDTISTVSCPVDVDVLFDLSDSCGLTEYAYRMDSLGAGGPVTKANGSGLLDVTVAQVPLTISDLEAGNYEFYLRTTDACNNESLILDTLTIQCGIVVAQGLSDGLITNELDRAVDRAQINLKPEDEAEGVMKIDELDDWQGVDGSPSAAKPRNDTFGLLQNRPNPFSDRTMIGFNLPTAGHANISIFDATGRLLKTYQGDFIKGYHEIEVTYGDLASKGVFYYRLETDKFTASRKMMVLE